MKISVGAKTDVGRVRQINQDSYLNERPLFVIADGMGGHVAGDVASSIAIDSIRDGLETQTLDEPNALAALVRKANIAIFQKGQTDASLRGMGTTCTLLFLSQDHAHIAHVGDSRAYLFRDGELNQITEDHTLVARMVSEGRLDRAEAERHPQRNIITRVLGVDPNIDVDLLSIEVAAGDRFLICSDGLSGMVASDVITEMLTWEPDAQKAAERLVDLANEAGGEDNITVLIVEVQPEEAEGQRDAEETPAAASETTEEAEEPTPRRTRRKLMVGVVVAALIGLAAFGTLRYVLDNSWFVGVNDDGRVTIFKGIPEEVAGLTFSKTERETTLDLEDLPSFQQANVSEGIKVSSLEEAEDVVAELVDLARDPDFEDEATEDQNEKKG